MGVTNFNAVISNRVMIIYTCMKTKTQLVLSGYLTDNGKVRTKFGIKGLLMESDAWNHLQQILKLNSFIPLSSFINSIHYSSTRSLHLLFLHDFSMNAVVFACFYYCITFPYYCESASFAASWPVGLCK